MAGPFSNPWTYAAQELAPGRWAMVNTCHGRVVSEHATREAALQAIRDRKDVLRAIADLRRFCAGVDQPLFTLPLPPTGEHRIGTPPTTPASTQQETDMQPLPKLSDFNHKDICRAYLAIFGTPARRNVPTSTLTAQLRKRCRKGVTVAELIAAALTPPRRETPPAPTRSAARERPAARPETPATPEHAAARSEAARKAWATRRANGWTPPNAAPPSPPLKRANLKELARA